MNASITTFAIGVAACAALLTAQARNDSLMEPVVQLQSGPLTPGLKLEESPQPIHQIRLSIDSTFKTGTLVLDSNRPVFDEFGELIGGIDTPQVRDENKGDEKLCKQLRCTIEAVKDGSNNRYLYRIVGPEIRTPIRVAVRGSISDGGPVRLIILGADAKAEAVISCTYYGLVVP